MSMFFFIKRNVPERDPETLPFSARARKDGAPVEGWHWTPGEGAKGTLFALHGFGYHCWTPHDLPLAKKHNLAIVSFDFRSHGKSSNRWPSFGTGESWDLRGAMDQADEMGLPRPFLVKGHSLGAMAAQRAAIKDERIIGCFLASPPSCPFHAVGSTGYNVAPFARVIVAAGGLALSNLINVRYGWDILNDGDIRRHSQTKNPKHRPLIFYIMGDKDTFEIGKTRKVYDSWYSEVDGSAGQGHLPDVERSARKWFVPAPGFTHDNVWDFEPFAECLDSFIKRCLEEAERSPHLMRGSGESDASASASVVRREPRAKSDATGIHVLPQRAGNVLHVDIGGGSVRTWVIPEMTTDRMIDVLESGYAPGMSRTPWKPEADGKRLPEIIQELLPKDVDLTRVVVSIPDLVSPNGRAYTGWMAKKCGVPENLSEVMEERLSLRPGSVSLLNDGAAWAQGARTLMRHSGVWGLGGVGVLAMGTGVGFAVVTQCGVFAKELRSGYNFGKLSKFAGHHGNIHVNLGKDYFKWMEEKGWNEEKQRIDATHRLELAIRAIAKKNHIETFLVGGGHAPRFGRISGRFKVIYLTEETLGFDPGYLPMIGLNT